MSVFFRLRVRRLGGKTTRRLHLEKESVEKFTYGILREAVAKEYGIDSADVQLSINCGKDILDCAAEETLVNIGIVSGDLITLVCENEEAVDISQDSAQEVDADVNAIGRGTSDFHSIASTNTTMVSANSVVGQQQGSAVIAATFPDEEMPPRDISKEEARVINRYLTEPVLLRDSSNEQIPAKLEHMISENMPASHADHVLLCIHILLTESGFQYKGIKTDFLTNVRDTPSSYKVEYELALYGGGVKMVCVVMGHNLIIYGKVSTGHNLQVKLSVDSYMNNLSAAGFGDLPDILRLPAEIIVTLMKKLDDQAVLSLGACCRQLKYISHEPIIWRGLYLPRFGSRQSNSLDQDWYELYKVQHEQFVRMRRAWREDRQRRSLVNLSPLERYNAHRPDGSVPGIVGGFYDIDPLGGRAEMFDIERPTIGIRSTHLMRPGGMGADILDQGLPGFSNAGVPMFPPNSRSRPRNNRFQPFMH